MFPEKKVSPLEDILDTIRRGDEYDESELIRLMKDKLFARLSEDVFGNGDISDDEARACNEIIKGLLRKRNPEDTLAPSTLSMQMINLKVNQQDIALKAVSLLHESLKKEKPECFNEFDMSQLPWEIWPNNMVELCVNDSTDTASKACVSLYKTAAKIPVLAGNIVDCLVKNAEYMQGSPEHDKEMVHTLSHLIPFIGAANGKAASKAKGCLRRFLGNFAASSQQTKEQTALLDKIKKALPQNGRRKG